MEANEMPDLESMVKSHEKRLTEQERRTNTNSERLNRHEERLDQDKEAIQQLIDSDKEKENRLLAVEENYSRLERTVAKENEETRATMREQTRKLFSIVEQAMGYQETKTVQTHELRMARLNTWSTVFLKISGGLVALLSSGGAIYYFIQSFVDK